MLLCTTTSRTCLRSRRKGIGARVDRELRPAMKRHRALQRNRQKHSTPPNPAQI
jgi:hypothetical protein